MSAVERVQAAIEKLTVARDTATPGPWEIDGDGAVWAHPIRPSGARITRLDDVCAPESLNDADLIATLRGTIDPLLATLERWLEYRPIQMEEPIVALADVILGVDS